MIEYLSAFCAADTMKNCLFWKRGLQSQGVHYRPEVLLYDTTEDGNYCVQLMRVGCEVCFFFFSHAFFCIETMNRQSNTISYIPLSVYSVVYMLFEMEIYLDVMTK